MDIIPMLYLYDKIFINIFCIQLIEVKERMEIRDVDTVIGMIDNWLMEEPLSLKLDDFVSVNVFDNHLEIRRVKVEEIGE
jgi:hypothetical protein